MTLQFLIVALLVTGSAGYAAWALMPSSGRRAIASRLLAMRLPAWLQARLRTAAKAGSGCGCDGCDRAPKRGNGDRPAPLMPSALPGTPQPMIFHPRARR